MKSTLENIEHFDSIIPKAGGMTFIIEIKYFKYLFSSAKTWQYSVIFGLFCETFDRQRLSDEYNKQLNVVLEQWETDVKKMKEQEEKLQVRTDEWNH